MHTPLNFYIAVLRSWHTIRLFLEQQWSLRSYSQDGPEYCFSDSEQTVPKVDVSDCTTGQNAPQFAMANNSHRKNYWETIITSNTQKVKCFYCSWLLGSLFNILHSPGFCIFNASASHAIILSLEWFYGWKVAKHLEESTNSEQHCWRRFWKKY